MRSLATTWVVVPLVLCLGGRAQAEEGQPSAEGYCDYVEGVAAAQSALLYTPEVFTSIGYIDQPVILDAPEAASNDLRLIFGVSYRLSGLYQGYLTQARAKADCRRHEALEQVQGETVYQALRARAKVLDAALPEAAEILAKADRELRNRRATAQEVLATRLRVDQLRELAAQTRRQLDTLPEPAPGRSMARALAAYQRADAEVERAEGRLRQSQAWDVTVRFGYDRFLENDEDESPWFAVATLSFNPGWFLQDRANRRAAAGRRQLALEGRGVAHPVSTGRLGALLEIERRREQETAALVADLEAQLDALRRLDGERTRRLLETVWFEWVQAKAQHEYFAAHVASLEQILQAGAP